MRTIFVEIEFEVINMNKYPKPIRGNRSWSHIYITFDKYPRHIKLIKFGVLSPSINIQNLFVLIISKTYQVDRSWSSITVDRIWNYINVDRIWSYISVERNESRINTNKYPRHINLIEMIVLFVEINIQDIFA